MMGRNKSVSNVQKDTEISNTEISKIEEKKKDISIASQWKMIWWRFKKHKLAMGAGIVLLIIYILAIFCGFFSPYTADEYNARYSLAPPQMPRLLDKEGKFHMRPFVYGYKRERSPETGRPILTIDRDKTYPIYFFSRGTSYKLLGLWETDIHLFGTKEGGVYLFGTDKLGRDMLTRVLYGARISTSIGFIGIIFSIILGILIGGFAGYIGGIVDTIIMRMIELLRSIPKIPLWMSLSAALPNHWSIIKIYLGITIILSFIGWTSLARQVRSKFMSLREEDFVMSARLIGSSQFRIIFVHMLPSFLSHIIASISLAIPGMIIGETSLSFLGLGLRPPAVSWGVLLQQAQEIRIVAFAPWLLIPGVAVIITVLAFNFLGDGIRDAADPYGN